MSVVGDVGLSGAPQGLTSQLVRDRTNDCSRRLSCRSGKFHAGGSWRHLLEVRGILGCICGGGPVKTDYNDSGETDGGDETLRGSRRTMGFHA